MAYLFREYPKVKYSPEFETKTVQNADEEKALGKGWYNNPREFPKPSRTFAVLDEVVKPWWMKWQWIFAAVALIVGTAGALIKLWR